MTLLNIFGVGLGRLPAEAGGSIEVTADANSPSGWALRATSSSTFATVSPLGGTSLVGGNNTCYFGAWVFIPAGINLNECVAIGGSDGFDFLRLDTLTGLFRFGVRQSSVFSPAPEFGSVADIRDEWFHLAWYWSIGESAGDFKVRVNGIDPGLDVVDGDTRNIGDGASTRFLRFRGVGVKVHSIYYGDASGAAPYNDIIAGTPLVDSQTVTGSGTSDWTGSDADSIDNHLLVDEAPVAAADTTDYIESSTSGHRQIFNAAAVGLTGDIHAVKVAAYGRDTDAGGQQVDLGVISNATEDTTPSSLPAADGAISTFFAQDPDGPQAWDQASRDALSSGGIVLEVV